MNRAMNIYNTLQSHLPGDVLLDDRVHLTIGDRLRHIEMMAYPFAVIISPKVILLTQDFWTCTSFYLPT